MANKRIVRRPIHLKYDGDAIVLREFAKEILRQHDVTWEMDRRAANATASLDVVLPIGFDIVFIEEEDI